MAACRAAATAVEQQVCCRLLYAWLAGAGALHAAVHAAAPAAVPAALWYMLCALAA